MHRIDIRLEELGYALPTPPRPAGRYRAGMQSGSLLYLSGQFPLLNGEMMYRGKLGQDLSLEAGCEAAALAALNVLAQLRAMTLEWQNFGELVRVEGYVSSAPGFYEQPKVLDGASTLFSDVLGEQAGHARTALSVSQLPLNAAIELAVIANLKERELTALC